MRDVANEILAKVQASRQQHNQQWNIIQQYFTQAIPTYRPFNITPSFGFTWGDDVSSHMKAVLEPHAQRLNSTYDWLEKFAKALLDAADEIDKTDTLMKNYFDSTTE
jgi:hypothetical protein